MKNLLLSILLFDIVFLASCGLQLFKEQKRIDMNQVNQFQDSIPNIIPGTRSIHTIQDDDATKVMIIVGSPSFYTASDDRKQLAAIRSGLMVLRVLGADNCIAKGTLVLTKKDSDKETSVPDDGIRIDMKMDSLKNVLYPAK